MTNSKVGRKLLEEIAPEAFSLLNSMRDVVTILDGRQKGTEMKKNLLKIAVKILNLYNSTISPLQIQTTCSDNGQ